MKKKTIQKDIKFWSKKLPGINTSATKNSDLDEQSRNSWVHDLKTDDFQQLMIVMHPHAQITDAYGKVVKPDGRWKIRIGRKYV